MLSLGQTIPTEPGPAAPAATPQCPQAPEGAWVNPQNCTQWLTPEQGAKAGNLCFFGTGLAPGRLRVGGNGANSKLYCGSFFESPVTDSIVFYGGAAALSFALVPQPYKYWVAGGFAALALVGALYGRADS
jgi:hypothetical protein